MRPPEFTGGNHCWGLEKFLVVIVASMRPPEFTGGNVEYMARFTFTKSTASMRPPEFTGGNMRDVELTAAAIRLQ